MYLTAEGGILGPISMIFGYLMNGIYLGLEKIGFGNIGIAIIIFTLITRLILYPMTVEQQKTSKMMAVIQPEIKAIQAKYQGKTDQQSMMAQQAETKAVYEKYGTSMVGNCAQLLIQMPIIFGLYRVIMNVPAYVPIIKEHFIKMVDAMGGVNAIPTLQSFFNDNLKEIKGITLKQIHNFGLDDPTKYNVEAQENFIIDFLYKLNPKQISLLATKFSSEAQVTINKEMDYINKANSFCGLNLSTAPNAEGFKITPYLLIPILAGVTQYLSVMIMQKQTQNKAVVQDDNDQMANTMKSMNIMMPLMSVVFCWGFATGIGVYWIASSLFMLITQLIVNAQLKKLNIDDLIKKNIEKANKKRIKKGLPPIDANKTAINIEKAQEKIDKTLEDRKNLINDQMKHIEDADKYYFENENKNSLFAHANMVQKYNEKNNK